MRLRLFLTALLTVGCAAQQAAVVDEQPPPKPREDDLAQAWAPPPEPVKPKVEQPPPLVDPRQPFRDELARAQAHLSAKELDSAWRVGSAAAQLAERTGAEERHKAGELLFRVAFAKGEPRAAHAAALAWHQTCGPEKLDACRAAALRALSSIAKLGGADAKALKKESDELRDTDECHAQSERAQKPLPCFAAAERHAMATQDEVNLARGALVKALAEKSEAKHAALLERAASRCEQVQCAHVRRRALGALVALDLAAKNLDAALKHSLKDLRAHLDTLPTELRPWGRTPELDRVCAQYDAKNGPGACRRVEKELTGAFTWRDYSSQRSEEGLGGDVVREVNEHYSPSLQECLAEEARRLVPPDAVRYEVHWTVFNDGRVGEVHLRKDLDGTQLAQCLRTKFPLWRYPRYEGEWQNVEQSFTVTATERRTMR